MAGNIAPNTVTDGLVLYIDAANRQSYITGSTSVNNLVGSTLGYFGGTPNNLVGFSPGFSTDGYWTFASASRQNISWGDNFDLITTDISGFVWGWANAFNAYTPWIDKLSSGGNYRLHSEANGSVTFGIRNTAGTYQQINVGTLVANTWYNIGFTFVNSTRVGNIYVNGALIATNTFTIDRGDAPVVLRTGYQENNGGSLNGRIATLCLYNRALSSTEVLQNYNALKGRYGL